MQKNKKLYSCLEYNRSELEYFRPSSKIKIMVGDIQSLKDNESDDYNQYVDLNQQRFIKNLNNGDSFGELGLIQNQSRNASVVSNGETLLISINTNHF